MELSRIHQLLSGNVHLTDKKNNSSQPENKVNPLLNSLLLSPDKLFNSSGNFKLSAKPLPTLKFSDMNNSETKLINENTRVLHIGDSHTVGNYGHEMDKLLRQTGAKVETFGSSGSSPSSWLNGYVTKSGFFGKNENGTDSSPSNWKTPTKTPNLNNLINNFKPNVIVFSLGANLLHAGNKTIEDQVRKVCEIAKASGAKIVWVGPPDGRPDKKTPSEQNNLYEHIQKVASEYGSFIDSRPYTDYPASGGDGVHYWGKEGTKISKEWASNVFEDIQKSK